MSRAPETIDLMQALKNCLADRGLIETKPSLAEQFARFRFERVSSLVVEHLYRTHEVWVATDVTAGNGPDNPHRVVFRAGHAACLTHKDAGCPVESALLSHKLSLACAGKDES